MSLPRPPGGLWTRPEVSTVPTHPLAPCDGLRLVLAAFRGRYEHHAAGGAARSLPVERAAWARACRIAARVLGRPPSEHDVHVALASRRCLARVGTNGIDAFVTSSYVAFDDDLAFARLLEAIDRSRDALVSSLIVREVATGAITTMRLTSPEGAYEVRDGDVFEPGVVVTNSADATGAFRILPASFRRLCGNWFLHLDSPAALRLAHRGPRERFDRNLRRDLHRAVRSAAALAPAWRALDGGRFVAANAVTDRAKRLASAGRMRAEAMPCRGAWMSSEPTERFLRTGEPRCTPRSSPSCATRRE